MIGSFPDDAFLDLHRVLATTRGPSNGEGPRRGVLEAFFTNAAMPRRVDAAGNLWVTLGPPGDWHESVVLDAHLDVVEEGRCTRVAQENGCLVGRGVADNTTALAMLALAGRRLHREAIPLARPVHLLFSVGEEGLGNLKGMRQLVADHPEPPACFIALDGSYENYSMIALGSVRYKVRVAGPGGHSWGAYGTPNAVAVLVEFLTAVKTLHASVQSDSPGVISYNIGSVAGGEGINSIARHAECTFEFRSAHACTLTRIDQLLAQAVRDHATDDVHVALELIGRRPAAQSRHLDTLEPIMLRALEPTGTPPVNVAMSTNINVPLAAGWPAACLGVCQSGRQHRTDEFVKLSSLPVGWHILDLLLTELAAVGKR